jgi:hypothetical protein
VPSSAELAAEPAFLRTFQPTFSQFIPGLAVDLARIAGTDGSGGVQSQTESDEAVSA